MRYVWILPHSTVVHTTIRFTRYPDSMRRAIKRLAYSYHYERIQFAYEYFAR